ncbi:MAG TPA: sigma-70 family RNA polymerase sigma factor [Ktedonosporobacter sp.]|nr:sigma-70 family RNA polymerase sigma factor [Ktedonosporobacter sp.]
MHQIQPRREEVAFNHSPVADLYDRYAYTILNYIYRYVASKDDADDLVLDVFVAAMENQVWASWGSDEQLAWLRRIAHNKAVDYQRRAIRRPTVGLEQVTDTLFADEERSPERAALRREDGVQLRGHLIKLPALQQEILHLRFAYGLRTKEIALLLGKSDDVIRSTLSRALNILRDIYKQ